MMQPYKTRLIDMLAVAIHKRCEKRINFNPGKLAEAEDGQCMVLPAVC